MFALVFWWWWVVGSTTDQKFLTYSLKYSKQPFVIQPFCPLKGWEPLFWFGLIPLPFSLSLLSPLPHSLHACRAFRLLFGWHSEFLSMFIQFSAFPRKWQWPHLLLRRLKSRIVCLTRLVPRWSAVLACLVLTVIFNAATFVTNLPLLIHVLEMEQIHNIDGRSIVM